MEQGREHCWQDVLCTYVHRDGLRLWSVCTDDSLRLPDSHLHQLCGTARLLCALPILSDAVVAVFLGSWV